MAKKYTLTSTQQDNSWSNQVNTDTQEAYTKYKTKNKYSDQLNNFNNGYQQKYASQSKAALDAYNAQGPFMYDVNEDALYNQYANQYKALGQSAMADTVGNVANLTGGYGNSYAQTAGQQAYNSYLSQLNNIVPELYNQAYNRYNNERNANMDRVNMYNNMEAQNRADWENDRNYLYNLYTDAVNRSAKNVNKSTNTTQQQSGGNTVQTSQQLASSGGSSKGSSSSSKGGDTITFSKGGTVKADDYIKATRSYTSAVNFLKDQGFDEVTTDMMLNEQQFNDYHNRKAADNAKTAEYMKFAKSYDSYSDYLEAVFEKILGSVE